MLYNTTHCFDFCKERVRRAPRKMIIELYKFSEIKSTYSYIYFLIVRSVIICTHNIILQHMLRTVP
jgi:hypothetical protein